MSTPRIEFFFDVVSPFSYLASTQVRGLSERTGVGVVWRPFFLGGVMKATGNQPPASLPARAPYLVKDVGRWARHYGVPMGFPGVFPALTLVAQRALITLESDPEALERHARELFAAYWVEGLDVSDGTVLGRLVPPELLAAAATDGAKARLREVTEEAVRRGAFGAPTFFLVQDDVGGAGEGLRESMYFGNDRLHFLEGAALRAAHL